jgi:hypothetical protein
MASDVGNERRLALVLLSRDAAPIAATSPPVHPDRTHVEIDVAHGYRARARKSCAGPIRTAVTPNSLLSVPDIQARPASVMSPHGPRGAVDGDATILNLRLVRAACIVAMHAMMIMMMTVMVIVVAAAVGADRAARVKVREQPQIWARNDTGQRAQRHSTPAIRAAAEAAP